MDTYRRKCENNVDVMYASVPRVDQLRCVICEIDFIEVQDSSAKSNFHWQTMKCRLLILLVPEVIASPVLGTERFLTVIAMKEYFESGKLQRVLKNMKLLYGGLRPVSNELYKACLAYTIRCKVAPIWNKVGEYYVQGRDFYNSIQHAGALRLDVLVDDEATRFQLQADKINVPYVKLEDFYLPETIMTEFLADPKGRIDLSRQSSSYMHVLPSMKRGRTLSISKEIPQECPFKDYDQLRRHWKNMYGYALPKCKDGILYYQIKFPVQGSIVFTYPNVCLSSGPIEVTQIGNKGTTAMQFLLDMVKAVSQICGKQLELSKNKSFNANTPVTNVSSDVETFRNDAKRSNETRRVEYSDRYVGGFMADANSATALSLKARLSKIHQIHNTARSPDRNANLVYGTIETEPGVSTSNIEQSHMGTPKMNSPTQRNGSLSPYFKIRKLLPTADGLQDQVVESDSQKLFSLREKMERAKQRGNNASQRTVEDADIVAMAKNSELDKVTVDVLCNWLTRRSIPHKKRGKKSILISQILSHIRNTQTLHNFRI